MRRGDRVKIRYLAKYTMYLTSGVFCVCELMIASALFQALEMQCNAL